MLKKITLLLLILFAVNTFAQEETLLGNGIIKHGGFGAVVVKFTKVNGEFGLLVGGRGGWIINSTFSIGGGGYGLTNQIQSNEIIQGKFRNLQLGYGGLELEYIFASDKVIHASIFTLIGAGAVSYGSFEDWSNFDFAKDEFFVAEPAVNIELNITSWFRINSGVSYRFISGVEFGTVSDSDLSGLSGNLTFKFGSF